MKPIIIVLGFAALLSTTRVTLAGSGGPSLKLPDFTRGDRIPAGATHDWNLGATGARGWMFCDKLVTSDARQIAITQVAPGSPAAEVLASNDVILGTGGKPFSFDPRTELGQALTAAESEAGGGKLHLTRWQAGKSEEVVIHLPVLGSYSATAPYACPKSRRVFEQGLEALAARMATPDYQDNIDPIPRAINALALLAGGDPAHLRLVKKEAAWAADFEADSMQSWYYGYLMMLLSEYVLATDDLSVMPGLKRLALETAKGQSAVGSWGHGFARPDGRLRGYGMMNSPGLPLTISLVMARAAGVKDPAVDRAIDLSSTLMRFYIGKGAIPYGDHAPWIETHDDNGKCGMAAVLFNLLGEKVGTEFFSRMSVTSHGAERDCGHTGNFFNMLWALPGVAQSGPHASGAWMLEFGAWHYDLARRWDGSFAHQGPPEPKPDSYADWDATGSYLLALAMPLKKIHLTEKRKNSIPPLDAAAAHSLILDGRGWNQKKRHHAYENLNPDQLLERLASWSPVVRERAAMAWARHKEIPVAPLIEMLESGTLEARYGACQALALLAKRGTPAVPALAMALDEETIWLQIKAAEALAAIGQPAMVTVPKLLELLARTDPAKDPRGMLQRYLCFALFERRGGMLGSSLEGVNRTALYKAVRAGLKNQDGRARGSLGSVYQNLTYEELRPLLPSIFQAVAEPAPSGEMFADEIRLEGLRLLAKHRVREGISACVKYTREQNPWNSQLRTPELMKILLSYGAHAKPVIPELRKLADYFEKDEKDFPEKLMLMKAACVRETIKAIQATTELPELISLD